MKRYKVKPVEKIELEFEDGHVIPMMFNMKSMGFLGEAIREKKTRIVGPEFYALIIYAGCRACDDDFTFDQAEALYVTLEEAYPEVINGILSAYCEAVGVDEEDLKKKAITQLLK